MSILKFYDDPAYNRKVTPDELVEEVRKNPSYGSDSVYPGAFGALSYHYTDLMRRFERLLETAREIERRKSALEYAIEYQNGTDMDEIYAAADVHEKVLAAGGQPVRRELRDDELQHGKVITDDERCSNCDEFMVQPTPYKDRLCCADCAAMFEEEEADPQMVA